MVSPDADTALILLAAGRSRRFGSDKLVAAFRGAPLWSWAARAAEEAGFAHRYLVVGPHSAISPRPGWQVVLNSRADEGMGTSIAAGVAQARRHTRLVMTLADMPLVEPAHLSLLASGEGPVFTQHDDGRPGAPAGFPRSAYPRLAKLAANEGAGSLEWHDADVIAPGSASLQDIDRQEDLVLLQR